MTRTTIIGEYHDADAPVLGARKVYWRIAGEWIHKGWMMPTTARTPYTKYPLDLPHFHRAR